MAMTVIVWLRDHDEKTYHRVDEIEEVGSFLRIEYGEGATWVPVAPVLRVEIIY